MYLNEIGISKKITTGKIKTKSNCTILKEALCAIVECELHNKLFYETNTLSSYETEK